MTETTHQHRQEQQHGAADDACAPPVSARSVADQLAFVLAAVDPLPPTLVSLDAALGLVLAADVRSATDTPPFDNSAMDGYAVVRADLLEAAPDHPVTRTVVADLAAGTSQNPHLESGQVARIMTGAPIPDGADAVVPIEDTDQGTETVTILRAPAPAAHIRRSGEDARAGDTVLARGSVLWPTRVAAAASAGTSSLWAHPAPRVAVISTGSELVTPGEPTRRGQIPDSNSYLLAAAVAAAGGRPIRLGAVPDDENTLRSLLASLAGTVDVIVLSGGVSVGAYDVVKAVLAPLGTVRFGPVKMQPGKPQGFGRWPAAAAAPGSDAAGEATVAEATEAEAEAEATVAEGPLIFALPGNPVSAFVSFEVFVRPALRRLGGHTDLFRPTISATAAQSWDSPPGRAQYMPVTLTGEGTRTLVHRAAAGGSGSHLVAGLGQAVGLAIVPENVTRVAEGDRVTVMLLS